MTTQLPSEFYNEKAAERKVYEDRAKEIARLTVPYLIREPSDSQTTRLKDTSNQSYGGRLINTLKAKMGMALLPPSTSSFRLYPNQEELQALTGGDESNIAKVNQVLSQAVDRINKEMELQQIRSSLFDVIAQLLVVGSVIVEKVPKRGIVVHPLQTFVVELDQKGEPIKMCIKEKLPAESLPKDITPKDDKEDEYELYTIFDKQGDTKKWIMRQELDGEIIGQEKTYSDYMDMPFRYLGWTWMSGDKYHRPYAEDYYQDMLQLDKLAKLLTDGAIISAKSILLVNERGGRTRKDDIANSENGDVIDGVADDVTAFQLNKNFDFQVPMEREANLKKELASAFLMNQSVTRDAERVTAEEIRYMARELETSTLSGIYSKLALQWSKWIVHQVMKEMKIKFESIDVEILTGLDAIGRSQEAQKLDMFVQRAAALGLQHWLNESELLARYAQAENVNQVNLLKTPDQVQAEKQQAMQEQAAMMAAEGVAKGAGQAATQQQIQQ